jgi:hypothetical protein
MHLVKQITMLCCLLSYLEGEPPQGFTCSQQDREPNSARTRPPLAREGKRSDEQVLTYGWFAQLGFPDVKGKKFVRVATGRAFAEGDQPYHNSYLYGFLLQTKGDDFTVLTLSLEREKFHRTGPNVEEAWKVNCEEIKLDEGATAFLEELRAKPGSPEKYPRPLSEISLQPRTEAFVLAWGCWRNGLEKRAGELFTYARTLPSDQGDQPNEPPAEPLQKLVANDLAYAEMHRAVESFYDLKTTRGQLLQRFERFVKNYPDSQQFRQAKEAVELLCRMVREDAEHEARP